MGKQIRWPTGWTLVALALALSAILTGHAMELTWGGPNSGGAGTPCATTAGGVDSCTPIDAYAPGLDQGLGPLTQRAAGAFELEMTEALGLDPSYDENISIETCPSFNAIWSCGNGPSKTLAYEVGWQCINDENKSGVGPRWAVNTTANLGGGACIGGAKTAFGACVPPGQGCGCTSTTPTTSYLAERLICPNPNTCTACGTPPPMCPGGIIGCAGKWTTAIPCRFVNHPQRLDVRFYDQSNLGNCGAQPYTLDFIDDWNVNAIYHGLELTGNNINCVKVENGTRSLVSHTSMGGMVYAGNANNGEIDTNGELPYCTPDTAFILDTNYVIDYNIMSNIHRSIDNNFGLRYSAGAVGKWDSPYGDHNVDAGVRQGKPISYVPNNSTAFAGNKCFSDPILGGALWEPIDLNLPRWEIVDFIDSPLSPNGWFGTTGNTAGLRNPHWTLTDTNYVGDDGNATTTLAGGTPYAGRITVKPCRWANHPRTTDIQAEDLNLSADGGTSGGAWRMYPMDWIDDWNAAVLYVSIDVNGANAPATCPSDLVGRAGDGNNMACSPDSNFTFNLTTTDTNTHQYLVRLKVMPNVSGNLGFKIEPHYATSLLQPIRGNLATPLVPGPPQVGYTCNDPLIDSPDIPYKTFALVSAPLLPTGCSRTYSSAPDNTANITCAGSYTGGTEYDFNLLFAPCNISTGTLGVATYYADIDFNIAATTANITSAWPTDFINQWGCNPACTASGQCSGGNTCFIHQESGYINRCNNYCGTHTTNGPDANLLWPEGGSHYQKTDGNILVKFTVRDTSYAPLPASGNFREEDELYASLYASLYAADFNTSGKFAADVNLAQLARNPTNDANCSAPGGTSYASEPRYFFDQNVLCFYDWNPAGLADQNYFIDVNVYDKAKNIGQDSTPKQLMGTESGLVSAWNFNKDDSNAIRAWDATSGNKHGELLSGPRWDTNTPMTPAEYTDLKFDGVDDKVEIADLTSSLSTAFTVAYWVRAQSAVYNPMVEKNGSTNNNFPAPFDFRTAADAFPQDIVLVYGASGTANLLTAVDTLPQNTWIHVAGTANTTVGGRLYVNGVLRASSGNTTMSDEDQKIIFGQRLDNLGFAHIDLDSVFIWNSVLNKKQIKQQSGSVLISANDAPAVSSVAPTGSGQSCTVPTPYDITWTADDADLDDVNFSIYYGTDASTCANNTNLIIGNISQTTAACNPDDTSCLYSWTCDVTIGNYYLRVEADDGFTKTNACSPNTLNVIPEYDEITMALAALIAAGIFLRVRRAAKP